MAYPILQIDMHIISILFHTWFIYSAFRKYHNIIAWGSIGAQWLGRLSCRTGVLDLNTTKDNICMASMCLLGFLTVISFFFILPKYTKWLKGVSSVLNNFDFPLHCSLSIFHTFGSSCASVPIHLKWAGILGTFTIKTIELCLLNNEGDTEHRSPFSHQQGCWEMDKLESDINGLS